MIRLFTTLLTTLVFLLTTPKVVNAQSDGARVLTGSAQPPLPFNVLPQPGFENRTTGWSVTSGTFTTTGATANVARGRFSASWTVPTSTSSGLFFQSDAITLPAGLYGRQCLVNILAKGNALTNGAMVLEAYDGTTAYGTQAMPNSTNYTKTQSQVFACPTSGTLRLRIRTTSSTTSSPTPVYFDEAYVGDSDSFGNGGIFSVTATVSATAGSTLSFGAASRQLIYVQGSGAAVTLSTITPLTAGTADGQELYLVGRSDTNTVTVPNSGNVVLKGSTGVVLGLNDVLSLEWDSVSSTWIQTGSTEFDGTQITRGTVPNARTTAASANTASAIVARDASGNFSAGTITATLSGNATNVSGTVAIANGGTGQTSKAPAFDALSPMSASGDIIYGGTSGTGTRLAKGTDTQVLTLVSGLPNWANSSAAPALYAPFVNAYTANATWNPHYIFAVSSASATTGATYTNNGITFTVSATIASGTVLILSGNGVPASSGTLTKTGGTGDATITFSAAAAPLYLHVIATGSGGGGGTSATTTAGQTSAGSGGSSGGTCILTIRSGFGTSQTVTVGAAGASGSSGNDSSFGSLCTGNGGGAGGNNGATATTRGVSGVTGGGATGGDINITGGSSSASINIAGAMANSGGGGDSYWGGGAPSLTVTTGSFVGTVGQAYGSGGSGGANGTAGQAGTAGGAGKAGIVKVTEYYQ